MAEALIAIEPEKTETGSFLKTEVEIPTLTSPILQSNLEKLYVALRFQLLRFFLISRYFGHPFRAFSAMKKLEQVRRQFLGDQKIRKIIKVDGRYYFAMNGAGIFSKGFATNYEGELNRQYNKNPRTDLRVVLFAITKKCGYSCEHCFEWDNLSSQDTMSDETVLNIVGRIQDRGVGQFQFGGGEPLSRFNTIIKVLKAYSGRSDFAIVTSGFQLTKEKAERLKSSGLTSVTISLDHFKPEEHDAFRGFPGAFHWVIEAVKNAKSANLVVNLSLCATRDFISEDNLMEYANLARRLGIAFIWLIEPRAVGHYKGKDVLIGKDQTDLLTDFYEKLNFDSAYESYPAVAYPSYHQRRVGCTGSGDRFMYIDTNGDLKSCPMCGSSHGNAETVDIDKAIKSMQSQGCGPFKNAGI